MKEIASMSIWFFSARREERKVTLTLELSEYKEGGSRTGVLSLIPAVF